MYQKSIDTLIQRAPFVRLVRSICEEVERKKEGITGVKIEHRWRASAMEVIQEATEAWVVELMENSNDCAIHAKRQTITVKDMRLGCRLSGK